MTTSTTRASAAPSRRAGTTIPVRAAAPNEARETSGIPTAETDSSPAASHALAPTNKTRPGSPPRSGDQPRMSVIARPKIGSADANRIAKMAAIGRASRSPRPSGTSADGTRIDRSDAVGRKARMTRAVPATVASSVIAAITATTDAERRVTASPEKATIDAPVKARAPIVSTSAMNGSPRTATKAARARAVIGSQTSSGSGARPGRRRSQPAPSSAATMITTFRP